MVELNVEISETETLEISIKTLHFLGFTDHAQMTNRDAADQHPIASITGLAENLQNVGLALTQQSEAISQQSETLTQQGEAISRQGEALQTHSEALSQHTEALNQQGETLTAHGEALEKLSNFSNKNIASVSDVQEVLLNA